MLVYALLLLGTTAKVVDFTSLLYPLTAWPEPTQLNCGHFMCEQTPPAWLGIFNTCIRPLYNSTFENSTYLYNATYFFLTPCANDQKYQTYCPPLYDLEFPSNCTWPILEYDILFPNEQGCSMSAGCGSNSQCINNVCVGSNLTQACTSNFGCSPGLRCVEQVCDVQLNVNDTGCLSDTDCVNTSGCNRNAFGSYTGTCLPYFSIPSGSPVLACNQYNSLLCESGQCVPGTDLGPATCVEAFKSPKDSPMECTNVTMCSTTGKDNQVVFSDCVCGVNGEAKSYCLPFLGDLAGQDLLSNLKAWVTSVSISGCNTERRFDWMCQKDWATDKADHLYLAVAYYNLLPMLQGNDECVQAIYTNSYYEALEAIHADFSPCLLGSLLLFF